MSVKKLITLTTIGMAGAAIASAALAGSPELAPVPGYAGVYLEGNLGYAYHPWENDVTTIPGMFKLLGGISSSSAANGGFTFGADLGYQFNQYFALEGGWYHLPKAKFNTTLGADFNIKSWMAYAALKGMAPIYENTYIFGKLGAAYTNNRSSVGLGTSDLNGTSSGSNYWNPMFAAGIQYFLTPALSMDVQYMFVPGFRSSSSSRFVAPVTHFITAGIGYKFAM